MLTVGRSPRRRILAVSAAFDVMSNLRTALGGNGCSLSVAVDSREGLDLVRLVRPDLILVDLALPRGDALMLLSRLAETTGGALGTALFASGEVSFAGAGPTISRALGDRPANGDAIGGALVAALARSAEPA
jgi:CheY-like chemotaxis protein